MWLKIINKKMNKILDIIISLFSRNRQYKNYVEKVKNNYNINLTQKEKDIIDQELLESDWKILFGDENDD